MLSVGAGSLPDFLHPTPAEFGQRGLSAQAVIVAQEKTQLGEGMRIVCAQVFEHLAETGQQLLFGELPRGVEETPARNRKCQEATSGAAFVDLFERNTEKCRHVPCGKRLALLLEQRLNDSVATGVKVGEALPGFLNILKNRFGFTRFFRFRLRLGTRFPGSDDTRLLLVPREPVDRDSLLRSRCV